MPFRVLKKHALVMQEKGGEPVEKKNTLSLSLSRSLSLYLYIYPSVSLVLPPSGSIWLPPHWGHLRELLAPAPCELSAGV